MSKENEMKYERTYKMIRGVLETPYFPRLFFFFFVTKEGKNSKKATRLFTYLFIE